MDIVIVLIVSALILYYLFGNPTERKFKLGLESLKANDLDRAELLFNTISNSHPHAKTKLNEIKFKRGEQALGAGNIERAYEYFSSIESNDPLSTESDTKLVEIDYKRGIDAKRNNNIELAHEYFLKIAHKNKNAFYEASKISFNKGLENESAGKYNSAIEYFDKASLFKDDSKFYLSAVYRKLISQLKNNITPSTTDMNLLANNPAIQAISDDFYYRYAVKLINENQYLSCLELIQTKLSHSPDTISELTTYIDNTKKLKLKDVINSINSLLSEKEITTQKIESVFNLLNHKEALINEFPEYARSLDEAKSNLFNKLVYQYLEEQSFEKCLNHILSSSKFYDNIDLVKNSAICCIRLVLSGKLNTGNYKKIISVWLTAIYNDDIFINSLESTSWDDEYTFSVNNTIGRYAKYLFEIKVDNINRNPSSDSNISIGQAQRELLALFESSLHSIGDEQLNKNIQSFYSTEKSAIENLSKLLGFDIIHCTPEFARQFKIQPIILKYLNYGYEKHKTENILELGSLYVDLVFNDKGGVILQVGSAFEKYASSKFYSQSTLEHIRNKKPANVSESFQEVINRFETIKEDFEEQAYAILSDHLQLEGETLPLIQLIEKVHKILPLSERVSYLLSETITSYCIDKINSKNITSANGLELLVKGIVASPENHRTAKNLAILVSINFLEEVFRDKLKKLIPTLNEIESESLYESFKNELEPIKGELNKLLKRKNIDYTKVRELIQTIDSLIVSVKPQQEDDDYEF